MLIVWVLGIVAALWIVDRLLLWAESRGWINYRKSGLSRGGAVYHTMELHSIFDPGIKEVQEVRYLEEVEEAESGEPLGGTQDSEEDVEK